MQQPLSSKPQSHLQIILLWGTVKRLPKDSLHVTHRNSRHFRDLRKGHRIFEVLFHTLDSPQNSPISNASARLRAHSLVDIASPHSALYELIRYRSREISPVVFGDQV